MPSIDTRRTRSSTRERSASPRDLPRPLRSIIGMTMSLLTMIASATVATMTMPVAAEKPPRNASSARPSRSNAIGKART